MILRLKSSECPIFGSGNDLNTFVLPMYFHMMQCYFHERNLLKQETNKDPSVNDIAGIVCDKIKHIWDKTSIPYVSDNRIKRLIVDYHKKYKYTIVKQMKSRRDKPKFKEICEEFKNYAANTLFDICTCKCSDIFNCSCNRLRKVSEIEKNFLVDQRTVKKMVSAEKM